MDKTSLYVKKIFIFLLVFFGELVAFKELSEPLVFLTIPLALLTISLLHLGFAEIKPPYLFTLEKSDQYINNKNSFWVLLKPILILVGFVYNIIVWIVWGIYLIYEFILDILQLVKTILYWIFYAILWFLKIYVPPIRLLYRWFIHYILKWPWWLYKLSFVNINNAYKKNYYFVSVWGTVIALGVIFIFYYIAVITGIYGITAIGIILSILPLSWSYGEISNIKKEKLVQKPYWEVKKNFGNGMESMRNVLMYLFIFVVLAAAQILFDLLGWIPSVGYSFLGVFFNLNTLISFILIVLTFILFFASAILPTNILFGGKSQPDFNEMISQLGIISRKFLRVLFVNVPSSLFGVFVLFLPAVLFALTVGLTIEIKDNVLDTKIKTLENRKNYVMGIHAKVKLEKEIEKLETYKLFPFVTFEDVLSIDEINQKIKTNQNNLGVYVNELDKLNSNYDKQRANLSNKIERTMQLSNPEARNNRDSRLEMEIKMLDEKYEKTKTDLERKKYMTEANITYAANYKTQTYIVFFFVGIWMSIFAGLVIAFFTSFMGNIYYDLYHFKEDGKPVYLMQRVHEENEKDSHQPLLGFTLLIATILVIIYLNTILEFINNYLP